MKIYEMRRKIYNEKEAVYEIIANSNVSTEEEAAEGLALLREEDVEDVIEFMKKFTFILRPIRQAETNVFELDDSIYYTDAEYQYISFSEGVFLKKAPSH